jgi:WhiB family redox-sensing transcriptional regulator
VSPDWADLAACRDQPTALFFNPDYEDYIGGHPASRGQRAIRERRAKAICHGCPVVQECLEWALERGDGWAVLGGTTPKERKRIIRRLRNRKKAP